MAQEFDVVVLGGGPGGYAAALYGAAAGLSIGMVEEARVGGTCLHRGCIPAKELLQTAEVVPHRGRSQGVRRGGRPARPRPVRVAAAQAAGDRPADQGPGVGAQGPQGHDVQRPGHGRRRRRRTRAPGRRRHRDHRHQGPGAGHRVEPPQPAGLRLRRRADPQLRPRARTSTDVPARVAVIGGGAIGCEFASFLGDVGSEVTVLEALPQILTGVDKDAADVVVRAFKKRGIKVQTGVKVNGADRNGADWWGRHRPLRRRQGRDGAGRRPRGGQRRAPPPVGGHRARGLGRRGRRAGVRDRSTG